MKIGFISPSFRALEINWDFDYEMVKLGVPTVMGHLYRTGHRDVRHWDFDAQVCDALLEDPNAFQLRAYFDKGLVMGFVQGTDTTLQAQTEKLLDTLGIVECEIYGISLSAVLDRIVNIEALISLAECMSVVLKQRYPRCSIVIGGLQASPDSLHPQMYRAAMLECPHIDYAFVGSGEQRVVQLFRNISRNEHSRNRRLDSVIGRETASDGTPALYNGAGQDTDSDIVFTVMPEGHHPAHTRSGAEARLAAQRASGSCETDERPMVPLSGLLRGKPSVTEAVAETQESVAEAAVEHPYDRDEPDASKAGPQEYEKIPAMVPIFDKELVESFRYTGAQIMKRFKFNKELLLKYSKYENDTIVVLPHIFVKGCNAPCGFCSYAYTKIVGEDAEETVEGLRFLAETYNCKHFHFLNTQINSVYQYCEAFCDAIIRSRLDILWSDCANMRQLDERLLEKMRRAGAMRLVFGVESPEDEMLKYIRKGITVEKVERILKASHDLGIWNHMLLIAGMPHETKAKQDRMMDFFVRTAHMVDFYSISSFYLIANSPWGREPEKWGIERISSPDQLLEQQAFNEMTDGRWTTDGLRWPEKKQQIIESTQRFYRTISQAKGQSRCVGGNIDLYLLMFLYSILGHEKKAEIVQVYETTAREIGLAGAQNSTSDALKRARNTVRLTVPVIVGRVNEGDQSSLIEVPIELVVRPIEEQQPHFCKTRRYTLSYVSPGFDSDRYASTDLKARWPDIIARMVKIVTPFAQALDERLAPQTPDRMAELIATNLTRYKPWMEQGFAIVDTPKVTGRTVMERNLQWSGVA